MTTILEELKPHYQTLRQWRHDFHKHPELSFKEQLTAKKIVEYLTVIGVDEIHTEIGKTGVVGIIRNGEGPGIGLRADMDALPITESNPHNYSSSTSGVMHACGHDGHVVMLLGAAKYLAETRRFKGSVVLIFQPAEELIQGAPAMLQDGLLKKFPFQSVYTLHSWPGAKTDEMFVNVGPVMASVNNFDINIHSCGGHAAMPHLSPDPIVAGCDIITTLQTLVSRKTAPKDALVISCSVFNSGNVYNVIPNHAAIKGTVRFIEPEMRNTVPEKMLQIIEGISRAHDVKSDFQYQPLCPPTFNTEKEALLARNVIQQMLGSNTGHSKAISMGSDDFCFYLDEVPGAYIFIGNGVDSASLHHNAYDFNDEALIVGASFYARLVEANQPL